MKFDCLVLSWPDILVELGWQGLGLELGLELQLQLVLSFFGYWVESASPALQVSDEAFVHIPRLIQRADHCKNP